MIVIIEESFDCERTSGLIELAVSNICRACFRILEPLLSVSVAVGGTNSLLAASLSFGLRPFSLKFRNSFSLTEKET